MQKVRPGMQKALPGPIEFRGIEFRGDQKLWLLAAEFRESTQAIRTSWRLSPLAALHPATKGAPKSPPVQLSRQARMMVQPLFSIVFDLGSGRGNPCRVETWQPTATLSDTVA